jgi:NAD(P)-dependent dehydrogenase (short-subunit alcohol dehydrogenase family)
MMLFGHQVLVTGASRGLGAAIAETLVREGASVLLVARDLQRLEAKAAQLRGLLAPGQRVLIAACDLEDHSAIARMAEQALADFPDLGALVSNAGIIGPMGALEENDWAAWQRAIAVNLLGTVGLCRALMPHFRQRRDGRIVILSGGGATAPMPFFSAYAASKAALVRFAETLAAEVAETGITVNAVAPGALDTDMTREVLAAGPHSVGADYQARLRAMVDQPEASPAEAAALCAWLCSAASSGITGRLLSARWDPWRHLPRHAAELAPSDIYTLRRIVPADRGKEWDE